MNKIFYFLVLFLLCFQTIIAQANEGKKIESFSKSKNFLNNVHQENPVTFYCQCKYNYNKPNWKAVVFVLEKII